MTVCTPISSVPAFSSPTDHATLLESTPTSFNAIPPVLRHQEDNITVAFQPPLDDFPAQDGLTPGTLFVIESAVVFMASSGQGFQIKYPDITLHAISRAGPSPSIYCQLDEPAGGPLEENGHDNTRELFFFPKDESSLERIFDALSFCSSLHPDKSNVDTDAASDIVSAADTDQEPGEVGRAQRDHMNNSRYAPY